MDQINMLVRDTAFLCNFKYSNDRNKIYQERETKCSIEDMLRPDSGGTHL